MLLQSNKRTNRGIESMNNKQLLKELKEMYKEDFCLNEEVDFMQLLDYLAILGIGNASELYMSNIKDAVAEKQNEPQHHN